MLRTRETVVAVAILKGKVDRIIPEMSKRKKIQPRINASLDQTIDNELQLRLEYQTISVYNV